MVDNIASTMHAVLLGTEANIGVSASRMDDVEDLIVFYKPQ